LVALLLLKSPFAVGFGQRSSGFLSCDSFGLLLLAFSLSPAPLRLPALLFTVDFLVYPASNLLFVCKRCQPATRPDGIRYRGNVGFCVRVVIKSHTGAFSLSGTRHHPTDSNRVPGLAEPWQSPLGATADAATLLCRCR
jgi:hypothetical protein